MTALAPEAPLSAARDSLHAELALLKDLLGMDVAMLTEVLGEEEVAKSAEGAWGALPTLEGGTLPFVETFCAKMLAGEIPNYIGDAVSDERVRDLLMCRTLGVGSWLGVPVRAPRGRQWVLCCAAQGARPDLGESDVRVMRDFLLRILPLIHAADFPG